MLREPEAPVQAPEVAAPQAPVPPDGGAAQRAALERRCESCGTTLAPGQDWCLECGHAAPGRIGARPGWRAGMTVVALTLLLVAGAVAAGYAALSHDANKQAATTAAAVPPPAAAAPVTPPPAAAPVTPPAATPPATGTLPTIKPPVTIPPVVNKTPIPVTPPAKVTPVTPATGGTPTPPVKTTPTKPAKPAGPQPITLGADAAALYDPYNNATDKGDPADAVDGKTDTVWFVTSKRPSDMGTGLVVDLDTAKSVRVLQLATSTPGFRVEVYGADAELPPDILDTRWAHITDRSRVDETKKFGNTPKDGLERIVLGGGTHKYRYILLWLTTPPTSGATVKIPELQLLG